MSRLPARVDHADDPGVVDHADDLGVVDHADDPGVVGATRGAACGQNHQFVNRRILTFRMRPKPINVAMIDEPP